MFLREAKAFLLHQVRRVRSQSARAIIRHNARAIFLRGLKVLRV